MVFVESHVTVILFTDLGLLPQMSLLLRKFAKIVTIRILGRPVPSVVLRAMAKLTFVGSFGNQSDPAIEDVHTSTGLFSRSQRRQVRDESLFVDLNENITCYLL